MTHQHRPNRSTGHSEAFTAHPCPDGDLPAALHRLSDAISALCDPTPHHLDTGHTTWLDPLYTQLHDSLPGQQGAGGRTNPHLPGCWLDALTLLTEIDTAVHCWEPSPGTTPTRLHTLRQRRWRPQDCRNIDQISHACQSWAESIRSLLTPTPNWTLPAPCPACNATTAYRRDSAGACPHCEPTGLRETPAGMTRCTHDPDTFDDEPF